MLSLKEQINAIDRHELQFQSAFDCYLTALTSLHEQSLDITPEITKDHRSALRSLHRSLFADRTLDALAASQSKLSRILDDHRSQHHAYQAEQDGHLRSLIGSMANAAETLTTRNLSHADRWKSFTSQLQDTARLTDLSEIKRELETRIDQLRVTTQAIEDENQAFVCQLQAKLAESETKLAEAEKNATTDALTGLLNRAGGEALLRSGIQDGSVTGILMMDLNGFKQINDRWGHTCGDQVLEMFSRKLESLIRPEDTVCRWGGDEFLVALRGSPTQAAARIPELQAALRARYKPIVQGKPVEVEISASVGAAEASNAKTVAALVVEADRNMYKKKNNRKLHLA